METKNDSIFETVIARIPLLASLQNWVIRLASHKHAMKWLLALSFLESIIFPIPTDPILAGVVLAKPKNYIRIAVITAIASTLGGIVAWIIGVNIGAVIIDDGWLNNDTYQHLVAGFQEYDYLIIIIGAFTPLPYKATALSAGFLGIGIIPFIIASLIGRTIRFIIVAAIIRHRYDNKKVIGLSSLLILLVIVFWGLLP